jgi:hypothetical protein
MAEQNTFYVYEHWRLDRDECFYIGKGRGDRAYRRSHRNSHWHNIVAKLERIGSGYEVRMVAVGLAEEEAFSLEKERIAFWRNIVDLANKTDGGDGISGFVMPDEARQKMSAKAKGRPGVKSMLGKKHSAETRTKMSAAKSGKKPNNFGKNYTQKVQRSDAHKEKLAKAHIGKVLSAEHRAKLANAAKRQWADPKKKPNRLILAGE